MKAVWPHWLALANAAAALFVALPFAAPLLLWAGLSAPANLIYGVYRAVCHQWAFRSYFVLGPQLTYGPDALAQAVGGSQVFSLLGNADLGYKVAFCQRDVAIYLTVFLAGLGYAAMRRRVGPLRLPAYLALIAPMALDGTTQLFGLRESTVELRTLTGALFGLASVWLIYPRLDAALRTSTSRAPSDGAAAGRAAIGPAPTGAP